MGKVSKEFWVSDGFAKAIKKGEISQICISGCNVGFSASPEQGHIHNNKVTITCEIDQEVTIKESDIDRLFSNNTRYTYRDIEIMKRVFFGGGENDV